MRPIYLDLYYKDGCRYCIQPKREFVQLPKSIVYGDYMVFFNMIDAERTEYLDRLKKPIPGTPTYRIFIGQFSDEYRGSSRDARSIMLAVAEKLKELKLI